MTEFQMANEILGILLTYQVLKCDTLSLQSKVLKCDTLSLQSKGPSASSSVSEVTSKMAASNMSGGSLQNGTKLSPSKPVPSPKPSPSPKPKALQGEYFYITICKCNVIFIMKYMKISGKLLSDPVMVLFIDAYMHHSVLMRWVSACIKWFCPRDNTSPVQASLTKFGSEV